MPQLNAKQILQIAENYYADPENRLVDRALARMFSNPIDWLRDPEMVYARLIMVDAAYSANMRFHRALIPAAKAIVAETDRIISCMNSKPMPEDLGRLFGELVDETVKAGARGKVGSGISKFLHIVAPGTFPIWDSLAYKSWKRVLREAKTAGCITPNEVRFSDSEDWGASYKRLVEFYRWLIDDALSTGGRQRLENFAKATPANSLLWILDKAFWAAGGGLSNVGAIGPWFTSSLNEVTYSCPAPRG